MNENSAAMASTPPASEPEYTLEPPRVSPASRFSLGFLVGALILVVLSFGIGIALGMMDPLGLDDEPNTPATEGQDTETPAESEPVSQPTGDAPESPE